MDPLSPSLLSLLFLVCFGRRQPLFSNYWRTFVSACAAHSWGYLVLMPASGSCTQRAWRCEILGGESIWRRAGERGTGEGEQALFTQGTLQGPPEWRDHCWKAEVTEMCVGGECMWVRHRALEGWIPECTSESQKLQYDTSAHRITVVSARSVERKHERMRIFPEHPHNTNPFRLYYSTWCFWVMLLGISDCA